MIRHISIIAAMSGNRVIGIENRLPWHLPADMRRFRTLTMGHHILMGRKTYESIGKPLPGRTTVIITHNTGFVAPDCIVINSIETAIAACGDDPEIFFIGGANLYNQALAVADRMYLTEVQTEIKGDAHFPEFEATRWKEVEREQFSADKKNIYAYDFIVYDKV